MEHILFLDIETVPQQADPSLLDPEWNILWAKKAELLSKHRNGDEPDVLYQRAGIYAEFGKVICVSVGYFTKSPAQRQFRVTSFFSDSEVDVLKPFADLLNAHFGKRYRYLCAHNGQEFDFPYLCRRFLINQIPLPKGLEIMGAKPWDNTHLLDTMRMWSFGDFKHFTSLQTLTKAFGIPSPKDDISGADVYAVYHQHHDLPRIATYCQKDVVGLAHLYCRLTSREFVDNEHIQMPK